MRGRQINSKNHVLFCGVLLFAFLIQWSHSYYTSGIGPYPQDQVDLYNNNNGFFSKGISNPNPKPVSEPEFFDLSYTYDEDTIFYPGQQFDFELYRDVGPIRNFTSKGNYEFWYTSWSFCMSEHGGTHIDAPIHFNGRNGWRLNEIPLKRLVDIPAAIVDVEHLVFATRNPDRFTLEVEHLQEHEQRYGRIPQGGLVIVRYGWGKFWNDRLRYTGWNNRTGGEPTVNFPGMSGRAALWLLKERDIVGFGSDTLSADLGNTGGTEAVHIILNENQVYILENVANLDYVVQKLRTNPNGCNLRMFVLPIKTKGTGGPTRILAYCKS